MAVVAVIGIARSDWLREKFRQRIIAEAEQATGGRVEIGAFKLDWSTLTAEMDNLTIHGTEPAGQVPFLAVKRVVVGFRIISLMERNFDVARLEAENPQAHLIIQPDGSTNIPEPPPPHHDIPKSIMDLRIGRFEMANGVVVTERPGSKTLSPWNARGENLAARASYDRAGPRYDGDISIAPLNLDWDGLGRVTAEVTAKASMERNRVTVSNAAIKTGGSEIDLSDVLVESFTKPVTTAQYKATDFTGGSRQSLQAGRLPAHGKVNATGTIRFVSLKDYSVSGAVQGAGIGYGKVRDVRVAARISATPDKVLVNGLRIAALGGEMVANGEVRKLEDVHLAGQLQHFDADALASLADVTALPCDGDVSGPFDVAGKLKRIGLPPGGRERDADGFAGWSARRAICTAK